MRRRERQESETLPAFRIIPTPSAERHHLRAIHGDKYCIVRNGESLNKVEGGVRFTCPSY
jgi:hypothetical protein